MDLGSGGLGRRPAANSLRAAGVAHPESDLPQTANQSHGANESTARKPVRLLAGWSFSLRADDLSAHRASHSGRHVTNSFTSGGAAARNVLRNLTGPGEESRHYTRRMGDAGNGARGH